MNGITTSSKIERQGKSTDSFPNKVLSIAAIEDELQDVNQRLEQQRPVTNPINEQGSFDDLLQKLKIDTLAPLKEPPVCVEIHGPKGAAVISTLGNFLAVIGKAKSRKTFLVSLIIAAFVSGKMLMDKIKCIISEGKDKVLLFDTEQSNYHVQKVLRRILATAELTDSESIEAYCLRTLAPKIRLEAIKHKIYNTPGISLVVIDGIKDLVFDINDGKEATDVTTELMRWSEENNCHIIVVLHQNKGDNNARGHLGTEVINKAETVITVAKDISNPDFSIVSPEYCRDKDFEPFAFSVDEKGLPYITPDWAPTEKAGGRDSITPFKIPESFHRDRLKEAFGVERNPKYSDLVGHLKTCFQQYYGSFGTSKAKDFVHYYVKQGWVKKIEPPTSGKSWALYEYDTNL